MSITFPDNTV